jgi:hypothetical protein
VVSSQKTSLKLLMALIPNQGSLLSDSSQISGILQVPTGFEPTIHNKNKTVPAYLIGKELFLTFPTDGEGNSTIHQHLQVGLGRHLTFCDCLNELRRYERQFR